MFGKSMGDRTLRFFHESIGLSKIRCQTTFSFKPCSMIGGKM